jgi:glucose-1-phosphate cytidylyltransferase
MKAVILAGGLGTRISEETHLRPKPMVEIGGRPILWHIMKTYSAYGITDFVIALGYRGYMVKEYFSNYALHMSNVTMDLSSGDLTVHERSVEPWTVTLVDTGETTLTGGRLKRLASYLGEDETFCFTYGDGLTDANLAEEVSFHRAHGRLATVLAVRPPGRYGALRLKGDRVDSFEEKPLGDGGYINGGFFVLSQECIGEIEGDNTSWEGDPLPKLAERGQLGAYRHDGFWRPMDTLRDRNELEDLWAGGRAPWKIWS